MQASFKSMIANLDVPADAFRCQGTRVTIKEVYIGPSTLLMTWILADNECDWDCCKTVDSLFESDKDDNSGACTNRLNLVLEMAATITMGFENGKKYSSTLLCNDLGLS